MASDDSALEPSRSRSDLTLAQARPQLDARLALDVFQCARLEREPVAANGRCDRGASSARPNGTWAECSTRGRVVKGPIACWILSDTRVALDQARPVLGETSIAVTRRRGSGVWTFGDAWRAMAEDGDVRGVTITFAIGLAGACAYLFYHLAQRCTPEPGTRTRRPAPVSRHTGPWRWRERAFFYALGVTALLWLLLSGTDEVVRGPYASLHIIVWAGFSLFIGVFFGLVAKRN